MDLLDGAGAHLAGHPCQRRGAGPCLDAARRVHVPSGEGREHSDEIALSHMFFARNRLSGYCTGEVLAPIGGETLPG